MPSDSRGQPEGYRTLSYGYQVPFGHGKYNIAKASAKADPRLVVIADKGPFTVRAVQTSVEMGGGELVLAIDNVYGGNSGYQDPFSPGAVYRDTLANLLPKHNPIRWRRGNSPNHGGRGNGQGQNVYKIDGSSKFQEKPCVGIDNDNIYLRQGGEDGDPPEDDAVPTLPDGWRATPWRGDLEVLPPGFKTVQLIAGGGPDTFINGTTDSYVWP